MRRLYTSPDSTPRTGGTVYTIQAVIEDIPENNSIAFMKHLDMFSLNDSEGIIQNDARYAIIGSSTYALLRKGFTPDQLNEWFYRSKQTHRVQDTNFAVEAHPMGDRDWNGGLLRTMVWTTMVAGVLILLVA